jgi:hypothetical protein
VYQDEDIVMKLSQTEGGVKKNKLDIHATKYSKEQIKRAVRYFPAHPTWRCANSSLLC